MTSNAEVLETISKPVVLRNVTCGYCGTDLLADDVPSDEDHVIARNLVPKRSLENQWNVILKVCKPCNNKKSDLEDDISAITMQPDACGHFPQFSEHPSLATEARKKGADSYSRATGKPVNSSQESFTHTFRTDFMTLEASYIAPPRIDEHRIAKLAHYHVTGFLYWLMYDKKQRIGRFIDGRFYHLAFAMRSDWGNTVHRAFMERVASWENQLVGHTAGGYFKVAIKRQKGTPCWSWALE